jgi:2'-5' RNA ligase
VRATSNREANEIEARHPMQAIRTFFAVDLDAPVRRAAAALARELQGLPGGDRVRWVRAEALHVTLRFLGATDPDLVPTLASRVEQRVAAVAPFRLHLGAPHLFPSPRRPRVVALELRPLEPLEALAAAVERGVVEAGFAPEARPFRAHLTLGRVKNSRSRALDVTAPDTTLDEALDVMEAVLFRSELPRSKGSQVRYTPLARLPLGAPGGPDHL